MSTPVVIEVEHRIGDTVYLKTDTAQHPAIVTGYYISPTGTVLYELMQCVTAYRAYGIEISSERNTELKESYE